MSQLATPTKAPSPAGFLRPSDLLLNLVISIIAPIFRRVTGGDTGLARLAAIEALNTYRVRNFAELIAVAQIIAYGLAALDSLTQSFGEDLPVSMVLRLRGNANALNRAAEQNRRLLRAIPQPQDEDVMAQPEPAAMPEACEDTLDTEPFLSDAAAELLAAEASDRLAGPQPKAAAQPVEPAASPVAATAGDTAADKRHREMWAIALVSEASEISSGLPGMPAAERGAASIRAGMLASTANQLLTGGDGPGVAFSLTGGKAAGSRVRLG